MPKPMSKKDQDELELMNLNLGVTQPDTTATVSLPPTESGAFFGALSNIGDILGDLGEEAIVPGGGLFKGAPPPFDLPSMTYNEAGQAIKKIPESGGQFVEGITSLVTQKGWDNIKQTAKQVGPGIPGAMLDFVLPGLQIPGLQGYMESDQVKAAESVGRDLSRLLRDPKGAIINDPIGAASELAAVVMPAGIGSALAGRGGRLGAFGGAIQKANPVRIVLEVPKAVIKKGAKALGKTKAAKAALATSTNVGEMAINIAEQSGKRGEHQAQAFFEAMFNPDEAVQRVAAKAKTAVEKLDDMRGLGWDEISQFVKLKDAGNPVDIAGVRARIFDRLEKEYDIKVKKIGVSPANPDVGTVVLEVGQRTPIGSQAKLNQIADALQNLGQWTEPSIEASHAAQRRLMSFVKKGSDAAEFNTVNKMLFEMGDEVRQELNAKFIGYKERADLYSRMSDELREVEKVLSINGGVISETTLTKLGTLLNDRLSSNLGIRRKAVERLSGMLGEDLMAELAGAKFGREAAQGIAKARDGMSKTGVFAGGALGAGIGSQLGIGGLATGVLAGTGATVGAGLQKLLFKVSIGNPRAVGRFMFSVGADPSLAAEIQGFFTRLKTEAHKAGLKDAINAGAALEALDDRTRKRLEREGSTLEFLGL